MIDGERYVKLVDHKALEKIAKDEYEKQKVKLANTIHQYKEVCKSMRSQLDSSEEKRNELTKKWNDLVKKWNEIYPAKKNY